MPKEIHNRRIDDNKNIENIMQDLRPSKTGLSMSLHGWRRLKEMLDETMDVVPEERCDDCDKSTCTFCASYTAEILSGQKKYS